MNIRNDHPLQRLFAGLVEHAFMADLGICDPKLADYIGNLLGEFVHVDGIFRMQALDGTAIREISRVQADAYLGPDIDETTRRRVVNRYVGDFTLFWTGVYPEQLRLRSRGDRLHEHLIQGKRSYGIASELSSSKDDPSPTLLRQLSAEFESCVHGLQLVRAGFAQSGGDLPNN